MIATIPKQESTPIANELHNILHTEIGMPITECDTVVHALVDIQESMEKVYLQLLPKLMNAHTNPAEKTEILWEIREEFRHIAYHIRDAHWVE